MLDKKTKAKIKAMVLKLREEFEKEMEICLSRFGIYPDKEWKHPNALTYLTKDEREKRKRIAAYIKRRKDLSQADAVREFIKEASYTWINRLIGLKCMETRGLIEEIITTRPEYGNRSKRHRDFRYKHPELASQPDDGFIPCLFEVFEEITKEIKVLFDPKDEYSLVVPRYPFLKRVIEIINTELDYDVYKEDELLGWVYQYFQTKEKDRIFEEVRTKKKKISGSDIIPVTSLYTEKYMVKFLVENSLGAFWQEMYPESNLKEKWEYFVEDPNNSTREPKPVKEIKFLDPACGSGHFLLYAFDVFYQMYEEEAKLKPEWAVPKEKIPEYILKYNLHGIDIDLRSIQLTALGLYMKAKQKNPDLEIKRMNLVAANAEMMNHEILKDFLEEFKGDPLAQDIIRTLWEGLKNLRELGSLLKIEEQIDSVIKKAKSQPKLMATTSTKEGFTWEAWKQRILDALKRYYEKATGEEGDINKQLFAREAEKGLNFIDLISQKYDVVATNPPYMGTRNMNQALRNHLRTLYPDGKIDLYAAFIERCIQFVNKKGYVSMITQQSLMFIKSFSNLRKKILDQCIIRTMAHLGPHAFEDILGEKVNTTMFIFSKINNVKLCDNNKSSFIRLVTAFNKPAALRESIIKNRLFIVTQQRFRIIDGFPLIYWISDKIRNIFRLSYQIKDVSEVVLGMKTSNNDKYVRFFWEISDDKIDSIWKWYDKESSGFKYYYSSNYLVDWSDKAIKHYKTYYSAQLPNEKYWFKEGIVFGHVSTEKFTAKIFHQNQMADMASNLFFPHDKRKKYYFLALLNSSVSNYFLNLLNPTVNFQVIDVQRIPFKPPDPQTEKTVSTLAKECVNIKKNLLQFVINDREFKQPAIIWGKEKVEGEI